MLFTLLQTFQPPGTPKLKLKLNTREEQQQFIKAVTETIKAKAVPLHTMKVIDGRGGISPTHSRPQH
jgi:hypothetical protein